MHMLFVQHHTFSCVFECCNNTLKAGQQYTGSKLNKKLEILHEVKTRYKAGKLYTRSKLNTKLGNYTRGQN